MSGSRGWCAVNSQNTKCFSFPNEKKVNLFFRKFSKFSKILLGKLIFGVKIYVFPIKNSKILKIFEKTGLPFFRRGKRNTLYFVNFPHLNSNFPTCESGFEAETRNLRKYKIKGFFLQRASGGDQDRLGSCHSIVNTADSVFLQ